MLLLSIKNLNYELSHIYKVKSAFVQFQVLNYIAWLIIYMFIHIEQIVGIY